MTPTQKFLWKKIPGNPVKKFPKNAFYVTEMTEKFTKGSWRIFLFLSIHPIRRPHVHQKILNAHVKIPHTYPELWDTGVRHGLKVTQGLMKLSINQFQRSTFLSNFFIFLTNFLTINIIFFVFTGSLQYKYKL